VQRRAKETVLTQTAERRAPAAPTPQAASRPHITPFRKIIKGDPPRTACVLRTSWGVHPRYAGVAPLVPGSLAGGGGRRSWSV